MDLLNKLLNIFKKKPKERRRIYLKYENASSLPASDDGEQRFSLVVDTEKQEAMALAKQESEPEKKLKKHRLSLNTRKSLSGWLFVLPFVIGIIMIYAPVVFNSIQITFSEISFEKGMQLTPVGFENYIYIFNKDEYFSITIVDGLFDLILQIPAIVIFSLFMAIILNQKMTGRAVFRAIFFLPVILSTGIIDSIDTNSKFFEAMENSQGGVDNNTGDEAGGIVSALDIQNLLGNIKLGTGLVEYVTNLVNNIFDIVSRSGVQMLIFLSGLQSISPSIYESCQIEGATAWETFWKITFPMISPMILVNAVYTVIDAFTSADNRVMVYIQKIYSKSDYAHAGAMAWVYVGIVLVFILLVALIMKAIVFYQRRD
ncbi:MAG: carbohydrate ABC transporter permease [Eubacteriales bacterium]